ncbi:hypothetical protein DI09_60p50 [Mitosporidium daphniae]|uniref:Mitochondrial carrier protein n=1 Tax=Mitosporidium daphniae TaxID=1485682 RepID=A0A098VNK6_9MICR|nr:uncharacterized protein DI09_60p50 [Mitosporidium daphniae]KGG50638.1 hypothetical protein DI09_60p50 [Mitosporidium daphniae]|eukprot:XP_013237082.1 uncharacterized protein DI09_60p50 [Mitosporidium daphniae]
MSQTFTEHFPLGQYLAASSIAAIASRTACHPLDTIKINFQKGKTINARMHPALLYRGYVFSTISTIPALSLFLATYERSKYLLASFETSEDSSMLSRFKHHIFSAAIAEVFLLELIFRLSLGLYGRPLKS